MRGLGTVPLDVTDCAPEVRELVRKLALMCRGELGQKIVEALAECLRAGHHQGFQAALRAIDIRGLQRRERANPMPPGDDYDDNSTL